MTETPHFLRLFSTPELRAPGSEASLLPLGKPLAVLIFLSVEDRAVSRKELAEVLWPDADPARGKASVRQALWNLRKRLGADPFQEEDPLTLVPGVLETDLHRFRAALETGDLAGARKYWEGTLLEGLEFPRTPGWSHWVDQLRSSEEQRFGRALASAAEEARATGDLRTAREWLETAVNVQPYQVALHLALIETLLENRAYRASEEALIAARRVLHDPEALETLGKLESRLSILRGNGLGETEPHSMRTEFVGRTTEFSTLAACWRRAKDGRSELALVLGAPGIGKTRLAQELTALVRSEGLNSVAVKAVEVERGLRWGAASEMVRSLHGLPGAAGISNRSASVLARLVPSLGGFGAESKSPAPGRVEAAAVTDALLDLVSAVAEESPLLLFVDDLQWVDRESRATLSHLARNLKREPVLLLMTCRTGEGDPEVARAIESLQRVDDAVTTELSPLVPQEVSELLALLLQDVEPEDLDRLARRLHGITQGNPLFIVEILKVLHGEALLAPDGSGKWSIDRSCIEGRLPVPETVESAILQRLEDLGEHAQGLAIQLARLARPVSPEELRRLTGLDPFQMSEGMSELFDRDLVRRDAEKRIRFVHDAVTEVARNQLRSPGWARRARESGKRGGLSRRWVPWALGAAALGAVALAGAGGIGPLGFLGDRGGTPQYAGATRDEIPAATDRPYGRGRVFVLPTDGQVGYWLRPPTRPGGPWHIKDTVLGFPYPFVFGPFRLPSDSLIWFVRHHENPDDPPFVGSLLDDGGIAPLWKIPGDVGFHDLSPDGQNVLIIQEDLESEAWYDHDLLTVSRETGAARVLFQGIERISSADWSPDGLKIALIARSREDTLHVIDPRGERLLVFGIENAPDLLHLSWCEDSNHIAFSGLRDDSPVVGLLETATGRHVLQEASISGPRNVVCLGHGAAVAYPGEPGEEPAFLALDPEGGSETRVLLSPDGNRFFRAQWVPDVPPPVMKHVTIQPPRPKVRWGHTTTLSALGELSDGTVKPVRVTWEALDPNRASVDSSGTVRGNLAGPAPIVARYATWIADTAEVMVLAWERPDVVLQADFPAEDLAQWDQFGFPPSFTAEVDGETVLSLAGDGRHRDGHSSRESFSLRSGARVELVFRLELTRTDRQRIEFCVQPEAAGDPREEQPNPRLSSDLAYCATYPGEEQVKFDARELRINYGRGGNRETIRLPEDLNTSEWTQFALEIQPDGQVALYVNQRLVGPLRTPLQVEPESRWRIQLAGASYETELYVRSLTVYSGATGPSSR